MSTGRHESFTAEYCTGETVTLYGQQQQTSVHLQTQANNSNVPLNQKGEPIKLPDNLESLPRAEHFPIQRHRWNTNEEIAAILINFERHGEWQSKEVKVRPKSGSMLLYSRKKVRYRRDGYCWKKRKDGKTTREDHMKLKVQGTECIYGCYVHSAILPTFHRRCYWLLQNPDMVLVHYLNVPYPDENKLSVISPSLALWADRKEWTKDELVSQLKPMFYEEDPDHNNDMEVATGDGVSAMVTQLMEWQKNARASFLSRTLECGCPDSTCADGQSCSRPIRRILSSDSNQVSSTTGSRARTTTMLFTTHPVNPGRITITTAQNGQSTLNTIGNNLLPNSTKDFCSQSQQQQILLKNDCSRDNSSLLNNRQQPMIGVPKNNRVSTASLGYKQQPVDNTMLRYTDNKQPAYHSAHTADEHVHVYQGQQDHQLKQQQQQTDEHIKSEFYDVTLDLSHDDIQQTLSANMPPVSCASADQLLRLDDNHNKTLGGTGDDDVFVNLDAFDMLTDLQELDMLENAGQQASAIMVTDLDENQSGLQHSHGQTPMDVDILQITDFCPEWAFPEGGVKVLITGPWFSSSSYTVMFDTIAVPSTLIQGGVLRCYCPAHDIGTVALQVVIDGRPISTTAMFEYRQHEIPLTISSLTMPHTPSLLKLYLLQKLDTLEDYLQPNNQLSDQLLIQKDNAVMLSNSNFEDRLVDYCDQMKQLTWKSESECNIKLLETGTTLLHIAAYLGYSKLVCKLLQWKLENASLFLELEVNVSKQDREGYTPLMWACKKGHKDTAILLCQWYQTTHSADNTFNLDFCQTDILESVHQYFNDFDQNEYYASENLTDNNMFTNPNDILCGVKKDINTQQFDGHNSQAVQMDNSLTKISSENENKSGDNIVNPQSVQYVKRPLPNSFSQTDEGYNQFCKPIQYYPSVNQFQKSFALPLQSPNSDSGISLDRSPVLNKSNFIICLVTSLSEKPAAAVAAVAADDISSDGGGGGSHTDDMNQNQSNQDPDDTKSHKVTDHEAQNPTGHGEQNVCVLTLAEQFIAAMPEHIKNENEHRQISESSIIEIIDDPPSTASSCCFDPNSDISTEFNGHHHEREMETPTSSTNISLSPMSNASQCSPISPPPTAADLSEFLHASVNNQYFEKNFSNLTLSDYEQRELYEAAKTIQKAYRTYKKREEHKEVSAASVIQNYYRRYKQFAYYKQITKAAVLIQNQFRTYKRQKRFKKDVLHYTKSSLTSIKRNQIQKRQNQAAKKIQHFVRHNKESMPPPVNFAEHTYGYPKRDAINTNHNLKYNMPTKAAQYSTTHQSTI